MRYRYRETKGITIIWSAQAMLAQVLKLASALKLYQVSSFWNSSINSPSGPLKKAIRI
jgi:hypothetical protein